MVPGCSTEHQTSRKIHQTSLKLVKNGVDVMRTHVSSHPCLWFLLAFLCIQLLVLSFVRIPSFCFPNRTAAVSHFPVQVAAATGVSPSQPAFVFNAEECPLGGIFVYDLPSEFNVDLVLRNCTELDPWNWQCGITNHGYGGAATELRQFLPENLSKSWYHTNQFSVEMIFHHRVLKHRCRTPDAESATAFYIPFYAGLAVGKFLWTNDTSKRDRLCETMLNEITKQKHWKKSNGSDHFLSIGRITWDFRRLSDPERSWGSSFLNMPAMKRITRFIIEKAPEDEQDVAVPYPTGFHPKTAEDLKQWQEFAINHNRPTLFTFIGASREWVNHDFRGLLMNYCRKESDKCVLVDCAVAQCSTDSWVVLKALLGSKFCLQPKGDSFTRRSVFDCMVAGSIPVFFWKRTAYEQYDWFLPGDPESYSVFIDQEEVRNGTSIKEVLMKFDEEEITRKRARIMEIMPRIIYAKPKRGRSTSFNDAFDVAVNGVLERIRDNKEWADSVR